MPRPLSLSLACLLLLLAVPAGAQLRPAAPSVRMTQLTIRVGIVDGVASTTLEQTWRNDGDGQAEATWVLPLPPGAAADAFKLSVDGVPLAGEVLAADAARRTYESIVRSRRDPGLLEYFGRGCLRARIFPIPAHGEAHVEVGFRAVLPELLGLRCWSFALRAAGAEGVAPERVVLDLTLRSRQALKNAYAPLAAIQVLQKDDHEVRASYEGSSAALTASELALYYGLSEAEFGLDLLAHRGAGDGEGTFLMLISPKREWQQAESLKKSIVFVLDTSGSMQGQKLEQAKAALKLFLQALGPEDRFDIVPFATEPEPFFGQRVAVGTEPLAEALARIERLQAAGGTNLDGALAAALAGQGELEGRVPILVFLTDGEATVGECATEAILAHVRSANAARTRIFALGVGSGVNTFLLDPLAAENGGARDYVRESERIDERARALFAKLAHPVMTDLTLTIDGLAPTKLVPARLPDLFAGDRIELFGRYAGEGAHAIRLAGVVGGTRREYVYEGTFPRETSADLAFLSPLWAERRVGVLLDAIRLNGPKAELVDEVERLGREYRIVTPYTSHLVLEPGLRPRTAGGGGPPAGGPAARGPGSPGNGLAGSEVTGADGFLLGRSARTREPQAPVAQEDWIRALSQEGILPREASDEELAVLAVRVVEELRASEDRLRALGGSGTGERAVDDSRFLARLVAGRREGDPGASSALLDLFTRRVHDKTFALRNGIWVDQALGEIPPAERMVVEAFSSEYFELLQREPGLAPYLALSTRLVVKLGAHVYEIVEPAQVPPEGANR